MDKRIIVAIGLFLCLSFYCFAQESHISVSSGIVGLQNAGTISSIYPQVATELVVRLPINLVISNRVNLFPYKKIQTGDGYRIHELILARVYHRSSFFAEVGGYFTHYSTSQWSKTAIYPSLGVGFNYRDIIIPEVIFNFRDQISMNHGAGTLFNCQVFTPVSKNRKFGLKTETGLWVVRFTQLGMGRLTGYDIFVSVGPYWNFK